MAQEVQLRVPLESLLASLSSLERSDKVRLWEALEAQLLDDSEEAEVAEARAAYEAGDFMTLDEHIEQQD